RGAEPAAVDLLRQRLEGAAVVRAHRLGHLVMASNRIMRGRAMRRALLAALLAALAVGLAACGGGGGSATDKAGDVEVLNEVLGRQLAAVAVYESVLPILHGADLDAARAFLAQEQE